MIKNFIPVLFLFCLNARAQPTIGLMLNTPHAVEGYTLFAPIRSNTTYLIDNCGHEVNSWTSTYKPGNSVYFLPSGELLRSGNTNNSTFMVGGAGGAIEKYDWNGNLTWSFLYSDFNHCQHHDIFPLPNGNVLAIAWERKTLAQALDAGRDPDNINLRMFSEEIIEIDPLTDSIVWRWNLWDHFIQDFDSTKDNYGVVEDHPELVDINYFPIAPDVFHFNGIDYNAGLDQIVISVHNYNEIWIIDHSTTTAEAASHSGGRYGKGGDLLYRWGNPEAYRAGSSSDQILFGQHSPQWIADSLPFGGSLLLFNNGLGRPGMYSSIEIITPPQDSAGYYSYTTGLPYGPAAAAWTFTCNPPSAFYSPLISGVQALKDGHYLICEGDNGVFAEIDSTGDTLWMYINPVDTAPRIQGSAPFNNSVFRCQRFDPSYPGFSGVTLSPGNLIEQNPLPDTCSLYTSAGEHFQEETIVYPVPAKDKLIVKGMDNRPDDPLIFDMVGNKLRLPFRMKQNQLELEIRQLEAGIYFLVLISDAEQKTFRFIKQ